MLGDCFCAALNVRLSSVIVALEMDSNLWVDGDLKRSVCGSGEEVSTRARLLVRAIPVSVDTSEAVGASLVLLVVESFCSGAVDEAPNRKWLLRLRHGHELIHCGGSIELTNES